MNKVKGVKLTHNFELLRNPTKSLITLSRAPHLEAEFISEGVGGGGINLGGVCPPGLAQIKKTFDKKSSFFSDFESW